MWKLSLLLIFVAFWSFAEDHLSGPGITTSGHPEANLPKVTTPVSQFLSQEVGKALIHTKGDIKQATKSLTGSTHEEAEKALGESLKK